MATATASTTPGRQQPHKIAWLILVALTIIATAVTVALVAAGNITAWWLLAPAALIALTIGLRDFNTKTRDQLGKVWVVDPQGMNTEHHDFYDPLEYARRNEK